MTPYAAPASQPSTAPPSSGRDTSRFCKLLYEEQQGYFEVCAIDGDPLTEPLIRLRWIRYTPNRIVEIVRYLLECAARYGNVYISRTLYSRKQRSRLYALPSRIVFVDDAPERPEQPYSAVVRTSHTSRHGYYRLEQPHDAATIYDLQRRAAAALGGDRSGADIEQVVRIPESFNTKHGGNYAVRAEYIGRRTYTIEQLRARWPEVHKHEGAPATIDWQQAERWYANRNQLINAQGLPWRFKKPNGQARRLLERKITPLKPDGTYDPSMARAILAKGLILHGYPDAAAAAILLHYGTFGHPSAKGTNELKRDIARLIGKYRHEHPKISITPVGTYPTKPAQPIAEVVRHSRARNDRPRKITEDGLFAWYQAQAVNGKVPHTRRAVAHALRISVPTVDRFDRRLRERRLIERHTSQDRRMSWVVILGAINIAQTVPTPTPDQVLSGTHEIPHQEAEIEQSEGSIEEHTTPIAPPNASAPSVAVRVDDAAGAVFAVVAAGGRVTYKRFAATFGEYFPHIKITDKYLHVVYARVQATQRRERAQAKEAMKLHAATASELRRMARAYAWKHTDARKRGNGKQAYMWGAKAQLVEKEIARRQAVGEWPAERRRRIARPLPPLVAYVKPEPTPPNNDEGPSGVVCSSQQAVVVVQPVEEPPQPHWDYLRRLAAWGMHDGIERHCKLHQADHHEVWARLQGAHVDSPSGA
jgi:hypothetical protein